MVKKEMIAMLLAGGQGSRLGVLTTKVAKPAVSFGGKYRFIDFPLSNCINSGVDTVGVLTQYRPLRLHSHIGVGIPWDLDKNVGGVTLLPPYERTSSDDGRDWYTGTANAIYQNIEYIESYNPSYVLILSGDHIYKMKYQDMLKEHKANDADLTIATMKVSMEEASRFGIVVTDGSGKIVGFEEKPENPSSDLASMGIYIFSWPILREALIANSHIEGCDFGRDIIPYIHKKNDNVYSYEFNSYWKDVGTLESYWLANMELTRVVPDLNLYSKHSQIYTKADNITPQYISNSSCVKGSIIGEGCEIYGEVYDSVLGAGIVVGAGSVVRDSIIMRDSSIGENTSITKAIIAEEVSIGDNCQLGVGEYAESKLKPSIYCSDLVTIGEKSIIPSGVRIGKNTVIMGETLPEDYKDGLLESGDSIVKVVSINE